METVEKKQSLFYLIIPSLILFLIAVYFRFLSGDIFYGLVTNGFSAHRLTYDVLNVPAFLFRVYLSLLMVYFKGNFFPAYLLLAPAILLGSAAFSKVGNNVGDKSESFRFLIEKKGRIIFIVIIFLAAFAAGIGVNFLFGSYPGTSDEFSCIFESDILASGKLYAEAPSDQDYFQAENVVDGEKWYSKYTIGWPLLLVPGRIFGVDFLINPLCAAFSIVLVFLITGRLVNYSTGVIAAFMVLFSPYFFIMSGTYFTHTSAGLFVLLYLFFMIRVMGDGGFSSAFGAGFSFGWLVLIRPQDAPLVFTGALPLLIYLFVKSPLDFKVKLTRLGIVFFLIAVGIGVLGLVSYYQTGSPFLLSFTRGSAGESWGFSSWNHTPVKGLWNVGFAFLRNSFWVVPFVLPLGIISFFSPDRRASLLFFIVPVYFLFYMGWYSVGVGEIGSRFYYPEFLVAVIPAASGLYTLSRIIGSWKLFSVNAFYGVFMVFTAFFMIFGVYIKLLPVITEDYTNLSGFSKWIHTMPGIEGKGIVFMRTEDVTQIRNFYPLDRQKILIVFYLDPTENRKLIAKFPDRDVYSLVPAPGGGKVIEKGCDNSFTANNYITAAINYGNSGEYKKSEKELLIALKIQPDNLGAKWSLGWLYYKLMNEPEKAIPIFADLSQTEDYADQATFYLGRSLGKAGKIKDAAEVLEFAVEKIKDPDLKRLAEEWLDYYRSKI